MANHGSSRGFLLSFTLAAALVPAQESSDDLHEVVVIGASVSAGYTNCLSTREDGVSNRTVTLDYPFKKVWPKALARVRNFSNIVMFRDPERSGQQQVERTNKVDADLVVAIDYLFWFCYGNPRQGRMTKLERGLKALEALECPLIVGDIPNMRGAQAYMLKASMIPDVDTLAAMNARVRAWAADRETVTVFSLAASVRNVKTGEQVLDYDGEESFVLPRNFTLQSDLLHTTRFGATLLAYQVVEALPSVLGQRHPLVPQDLSLKKLVEALGIEEDLPPKKKVPVRN